MNISKKEYKQAEGYLKRFNYNCTNIVNIRTDIIGIRSYIINGMPKTSHRISDTVFDSVVKLEENKQLQNSLRELKIVIQALESVNKDCKFLFERLYVENKTKYEIINSGMSERTYFRRKKDLIIAVNKELKKVGRELAVFL